MSPTLRGTALALVALIVGFWTLVSPVASGFAMPEHLYVYDSPAAVATHTAKMFDDAPRGERTSSARSWPSTVSSARGRAPKATSTFHRLESKTQTAGTARKQQRSGQIWGRPNRGSDTPSVDAYEGPLPPGKRGIEFETDVTPNAGSPPGRARWYGDRPGVRNEDGYAKICGRVTKNTQC